MHADLMVLNVVNFKQKQVHVLAFLITRMMAEALKSPGNNNP